MKVLSLTGDGGLSRFRAPKKKDHPNECGRGRNLARPEALVSGPDPDAAAFLGGSRLRHPAALRHGSRCRHVPPGDDLALARAEALARRLRPAVASSQG